VRSHPGKSIYCPLLTYRTKGGRRKDGGGRRERDWEEGLNGRDLGGGGKLWGGNYVI